MRAGKQEPSWLVLIPPVKGDKEAPRGVRAKFAPVTRSMRRMVQWSMTSALAGIDLSVEPATAEEAEKVFGASEAASRALIRLGLLEQPEPEWDGVLDLDGKPLPITAETIDMVLENDEFFEAADRLYVLPSAERDAEKNGSSASPNGIGEAGTPARGTASSSVGRKPRGAAKAAPIPSKSPAPRKGKGSGRS